MSQEVIEETKTLNSERERVDKISDLINHLDYDKLSSSLASIEESEKQVKDHTNRLEIALQKKKLLEDIPCGSSFPTCKFIRDAHVATATIPEMESKIDELEETLNNLNPKIVRDHLDKYRKLEEKRGQTEIHIRDLTLSIERNKMALERLNVTSQDLRAKELEYEENREAIESLEKLLKEKEGHAKKIKSFEAQARRINQKKIDLYKLFGSEEQRLRNLEEQRLEYSKIQT